MLWGGQIGIKTDEFGPLASRLDLATAMYYFANLQGQTNNGAVTPRTNTLSWDASQNVNQPPIGTWYKYQCIRYIATLDNQTSEIPYSRMAYIQNTLIIYAPITAIHKTGIIAWCIYR